MGNQTDERVRHAIAENVCRLRTLAGWSLDETAMRAGVSKGMLFQIERAATNPSIGTLCKIANAFHVTLQSLLSAPSSAAAETIAVADAVNLWSGAGEGIAKLLFGVDDASLIELWRWSIPAGVSHAADAHPAGAKEMALVLKGTLEMTVGESAYAVRTNHAILFEADRPHIYANKHSSMCEFVLVVIEPRTATPRLQPAQS